MKKVFYILNLLFLTLSVFGGSVFATAGDSPEYYLNENGIPTPIPVATVKPLAAAPTAASPLAGGWYYIDNTNQSTNKNSICLSQTSGTEVNIVVDGIPTLTLGGAIFVPSDATLNFWSATNENGTVAPASLTINGSYKGFVIGNGTGTQAGSAYGNNTDFGNITFNSGTYTITNNQTNGIAIGSDTNSGGTITVNRAATVRPYVGGGGTLVGTPAGGQKCTINVDGGLLDCTSGNGQYAFGISVGTGSLEVSNQGKILTLTDPTGLDNWTIADSGGIIGYPAGGQYPVPANQWAVMIGGNVTAPAFNEEGNPDQSYLAPPANSQQWNSVTVDTGAVLTLGADDAEGNLRKADFLVTGGNSFVENNGTVIVNAINQSLNNNNTINGIVTWDNNPGSTLTINEGTSSALTVYGFNNGSPGSSQQASTVNLYGNLQIASSPSVNATGVFNNYSQLNVGPTGQVVNVNYENGAVQNGGKLVNNAGGNVTSQNPCYYGNHSV